MTLIVAAYSSDGIVIAGDKRSVSNSTNLPYNDTNTKVFKLNLRVVLGGAGSGYDAMAIIDEVLQKPNLEHMDVIEVRDLLTKIAQEKLLQWRRAMINQLIALRQPIQQANFGFILAGYDKNNTPIIYSFSDVDHDPNKSLKSYCTIGIPLVADYILLKEHTNKLSLPKLEALIQSCIEETALVSAVVSHAFDLKSIPQASNKISPLSK